ncbi:MATE family efflux transporter [Clostridium culturomicium]|uniref:MATE family efflux transporter n=1 Tax=Clostridium culturomicium TaxID=1499683 RepID=UPI00058E4B65|nr:MATE family efflux transporter [Clostridium culturomicium]
MGINPKIFSDEKTYRVLLRFAIPAIFSLLVAELYNMVDTVFVGQCIGPNAIGALTVAFPIQRFLIALAFLIAVGASTYVSRYSGENEPKKVKQTIINSIILTIITLTIIPAILFLFRGTLLYKLGASEVTFGLTNDYISIIFIGAIFQGITIVCSYIMTALGNSKIGLYANSLGAFLNIIVDYILVAELNVGISGAAIATVGSQFVAMLFVLYKFRDVIKHFELKLSLKDNIPKLDTALIKGIVAVGFSTFVIEISDAIVAVVLNNLLITRGGDAAIIIVGVITKISMFMFIAIIGISSAMQPIVAFNYGARNFDRVKKTVKASIKTVTIVSLAFGVFLMYFAPQMISLFLTDANLLPEAVSALRIVISLLPLVGFYYVGIYYYQAINEAKKGFRLSLFRQLIVFIPLAIVFVQVFGIVGAWIAYPVSDLISAIVAYTLLNSTWKDKTDIITSPA